jgi:hypothetical protein
MTESATQVPMDADVREAVQHEISRAADTVREMEADAKQKGIPLKLSGARYRIYETTKRD